ncbi:MAG: antitoxin VbhA family protein [Candidatus Microsaccharimonas sp.]
MITSKNARREKAVSAAIWSVKAEGLRSSKSASRNLKQYASGKISAKQLRTNTTLHVQSVVMRHTVK